MAKNQIVVRPDGSDTDGLIVAFGKREFSDFIFSLLSTPREERKRILEGFDFIKADVKILVDKITQQIQSHNDLLNSEVVVETIYSDGSEVVCNSYEQFFNVDDLRLQPVVEVQVTLSYVVGFTRMSEQKSYEKQIVSILIKAGKIGEFQINIRSTDVSWPSSIFLLIEKEIKSISNRTVNSPLWIRSKWFIFANFFAYRGVYSNKLARTENFLNVAFLGAMTSMVVGVFAVLRLDPRIRFGSGSYVVNDSGVSIVNSDINELIKKFGPEIAAQKIDTAATLAKAGWRYEGESIFIQFGRIFSDLGVSAPILGVAVTLYLYFNYRAGLLMKESMIGRIFLENEKPERRPIIDISSGIFPSLLGGFLASMVASVVWAMFH